MTVRHGLLLELLQFLTLAHESISLVSVNGPVLDTLMNLGPKSAPRRPVPRSTDSPTVLALTLAAAGETTKTASDLLKHIAYLQVSFCSQINEVVQGILEELQG